MELEQEWKLPDKNGIRMRSRNYFQNGNITEPFTTPLVIKQKAEKSPAKRPMPAAAAEATISLGWIAASPNS